MMEFGKRVIIATSEEEAKRLQFLYGGVYEIVVKKPVNKPRKIYEKGGK